MGDGTTVGVPVGVSVVGAGAVCVAVGVMVNVGVACTAVGSRVNVAVGSMPPVTSSTFVRVTVVFPDIMVAVRVTVPDVSGAT